MSNICHIYDERAIFFNHIASWRLRVQIPAKELRKSGYKVYCHTKPDNDAINIYHKHNLNHGVEWIQRTGGIFDIVDDNFKAKIGDRYREMCKHAEIITCSTEGLKNRIFEETNKLAVVVKDPYDNTQYKFRHPEYKNTRSLVWFGSETNLFTLQGLNIPCKKDLVTHSGLQQHSKEELYSLEGWNYIPWVNGIMPNIFSRHDIALVTYENSLKHNAKSPNRIVDALRSGMIVVTNNLKVPSAYGLQDFVIYDTDINKAIESVWENPQEAVDMVKMGQEFIERTLAPKVIAKAWENVFEMEGRQHGQRYIGGVHGFDEKLRVL